MIHGFDSPKVDGWWYDNHRSPWANEDWDWNFVYGSGHRDGAPGNAIVQKINGVLTKVYKLKIDL